MVDSGRLGGAGVRQRAAGTLLVATLLGTATAAQDFGFTERYRTIPAGSGFRVAEAADFDGDGDLDVFVSRGSSDLSLLLNEGQERFTPRGGEELGVEPPGSLLAGRDILSIDSADVDGDGDLDVVLGQEALPFAFLLENTLLRNNGEAVFQKYPGPTGGLEDDVILLEDVDGDGDPDAIVFSSAYLLVERNDGTGTFTCPVGCEVDLSSFPIVRTVLAGDVDLDGDPDIVLGSVDAPILLRNDGSGAFTHDVAAFPPDEVSVRDLDLGDVDGDGDPDLLASSSIGHVPYQDTLYLNDGTGRFTNASANLPSSQLSSFIVKLVDLTGDGRAEAVLAKTDQPVVFHPNDGTGVFGPAVELFIEPQLYGGPSTSLIALDLSGDGDVDFLRGGAYSTRLYLGDGQGAFVDVTEEATETEEDTYFVAGAPGDVNGDGRTDLVAAGRFEVNRVFLLDELGGYSELDGAFPVPDESPDTRDLALGDLDADGDLDVVAADSKPNGDLFLGDGTGSFGDESERLPLAGANAPRSVVLGDLDADGDLDLLLGNALLFSGLKNRMFLNDGAALFTQSFAIPQDPTLTNDIALGDVDGDGDLDAFVGNGLINASGGVAESNDLLLNAGVASLTEVASGLEVPVERTTAVAFVDIDGDGDLDAFARNGALTPPCPDQLHLGDGTGAFTPAPVVHPAQELDEGGGILFGDLDLDGDLDAIRTGTFLLVYENDGAGLLTGLDPEAFGLPDGALLPLLEDLDGDGDLDAVELPKIGFSNVAEGLRDRPLILVNELVQTLWCSYPRTGEALALDLDGPPSGFWLLSASTLSAEVPVPPYGTLRLDPATLVTLGSGAFDAEGSTTLELPVPDDPALVGVTLFWQTLVGLPLRFSNLERTLFTGF